MAEMEPHKIAGWGQRIVALVIFIVFAPLFLVTSALEIIMASLFDDGGDKHA